MASQGERGSLGRSAATHNSVPSRAIETPRRRSAPPASKSQPESVPDEIDLVAQANADRPLRVARTIKSHGSYNPTRVSGERRVSLPTVVVSSLLVVLILGLVGVQAFVGLPGLAPWFTPAPAVAPATGAVNAVSEYLEALKAGDAAAALAMSRPKVRDMSCLTNEFLQATIAKNPISQIGNVKTLGEGSNTQQLVSASYQIGAEKITNWFNVDLIDGVWLLSEVTSSIDLSSVSPELTGLKLNGFAVSTDIITLFPGIYELTIENQWIEVAEDRLIVEAPRAGQSFFSAALLLTKTGSSEVSKAITTKLDTCLKTQELAPTGCGFGIRITSDKPIKKSTIRWKITAGENEVAKIKPALALGSVMQTRNYVNIEFAFRGIDESEWLWEGQSTVRVVMADLSQEEIAVVFA